MPAPPHSAARRVRTTARRLGVRLVVQRRFARELFDADDCFVIDRAPFAELFPRCAAVVHHGGAGTVHTALRAGRPQAIAPIFADQLWFAWRVYEAGLGPRPLPSNLAVSPVRLHNAFARLLGDRTIAETAARAGELARAEDGPARPVAILEALHGGADAAWAPRSRVA